MIKILLQIKDKKLEFLIKRKLNSNQKNLLNTNVINENELVFSDDYIKSNIKLVHNFIKELVSDYEINTLIIKESFIAPLILHICSNIPSIKNLYLLEETLLNYDTCNYIIKSNNIKTVYLYNIPTYLLELLDSKNIKVNSRNEILFTSSFTEQNNLNTFSSLYYKTTIYLTFPFNKEDEEDFLSFIKINKYLKKIYVNKISKKDIEFILEILYKYKLKNIKDLKLFNKYCDEHGGRNPNVPQGVTSVSDFVFKDNSKIKILKLPETTICLCKQCCKNCINLEKVYLSKKFLDFGEEVFYGCTSLSGTFNIPKSLCILRANVFKNCNDNLKIKIFGKYISSLNNFLLKGDLKDLPNIVNQNVKATSKSLITNNYIYVLRDNKCYKITKKMYSHLIGFDKNTGENKILIREIFYHNKGIKLLLFIENCNKYNIKLPMEKIICNTPDDKIEYFCKEYNSFCKKIIKEVRNVSTYKTKNDKGELVGRLTKKQYYIIYAYS